MIGPTEDEVEQKSVFKDDKTQQELNAPLKRTENADKADEEFLGMLLKLIEEGKIELYRPGSLINHEVYDKLSEDKQGRADLEAVNMLAAIRDIRRLHAAGYVDTFQMENLVHRLRVTKERIEEEGGDLFII